MTDPEERVKGILGGDADRAEDLHTEGKRLGNSFQNSGKREDLDKAISILENAITLRRNAGFLNTLGVFYNYRFEDMGAIADLEKAICLTQEAANGFSNDLRSRACCLHNLGTQLDHRFQRMSQKEDLDEAVRVTREAGAVQITLDEEDRSIYLNALGIRLGNRFDSFGNLLDLDEAISSVEKAIEITHDSSNLAWYLNNLAARLRAKFLRIGDKVYLEQAISAAGEAVNKTPQNNQDWAPRLITLAMLLDRKFRDHSNKTDLAKSKECFLKALNSESAPIYRRVDAGARLLSDPDILGDGYLAYDIAKTTIDLIPLLAPRALRPTDKQHLLSQVVGLPSDAAAIALHVGKKPVSAIKFLETGRGVLASSLQSSAKPIYVKAGQRHKTITQIEAFRGEIGSHGFHQPPSSVTESQMLKAAAKGPIIILNVSSHRCDALIIEQSGIRVLKLELTHKDVQTRADKLQSLETLSWLWKVIVEPVLENLHISSPPVSEPWPHVWWIPTGPLVKFPLHAAGYHLGRSLETALDRVISSYSSSIKSIINTPEWHQDSIAACSKVVLVSMEKTPEECPLENAIKEIDAVKAVCEDMELTCVIPDAYKSDILSALETCGIFHFAGHGSTYSENPLQSRLLLKDYQNYPLTVESLLETNVAATKSFDTLVAANMPFLAYLSACGTSQILDNKSIDENIHLTNAFQLAGFRHVIGTLWEVSDPHCVKVAKILYETIRDEGMKDEAVSRGLHKAIRTLRDEVIKTSFYVEEGRQATKTLTIDTGSSQGILGDRDMLIVLAEVQDSCISASAEPVIDRSSTDSIARHGKAIPSNIVKSNFDSLELYWVPYIHFGV
ncbi:CHAT domain-containing protein [Hyaloscypha sp. PMI_1271]|nr:CHAT domain-containing protein [Hyaloscypha sp. PMI_1271]